MVLRSIISEGRVCSSAATLIIPSCFAHNYTFAVCLDQVDAYWLLSFSVITHFERLVHLTVLSCWLPFNMNRNVISYLSDNRKQMMTKKKKKRTPNHRDAGSHRTNIITWSLCLVKYGKLQWNFYFTNLQKWQIHTGLRSQKTSAITND